MITRIRTIGFSKGLAIPALLLASLLVVSCCSAVYADRYKPREAPGPIHGNDPHGGDPHGGDPHWAPPHDPDLPANANDRDPYGGMQDNSPN